MSYDWLLTPISDLISKGQELHTSSGKKEPKAKKLHTLIWPCPIEILNDVINVHGISAHGSSFL